MARHTDLEFIEDLLDEFDLDDNQKISTLKRSLEEYDAEDEAEETDD